MATFFIGMFIGFGCGLLVAALVRANDAVECLFMFEGEK